MQDTDRVVAGWRAGWRRAPGRGTDVVGRFAHNRDAICHDGHADDGDVDADDGHRDTDDGDVDADQRRRDPDDGLLDAQLRTDAVCAGTSPHAAPADVQHDARAHVQHDPCAVLRHDTSNPGDVWDDHDADHDPGHDDDPLGHDGH